MWPFIIVNLTIQFYLHILYIFQNHTRCIYINIYIFILLFIYINIYIYRYFYVESYGNGWTHETYKSHAGNAPHCKNLSQLVRQDRHPILHVSTNIQQSCRGPGDNGGWEAGPWPNAGVLDRWVVNKRQPPGHHKTCLRCSLFKRPCRIQNRKQLHPIERV